MRSLYDETNWSKVERHKKLRLGIGDAIRLQLLDTGKYVRRELLQKEEGTIPQRDSIIYVVEDVKTKEKFEWWVPATDFSVLRKLADMRASDSGNLVGVVIDLKRVSLNPKRKNYEIAQV